MANERLLEDMLEADTALLGLPNRLMVVGRQVVTDFGGRVDLLCTDEEGMLYVIEIKKDRTPREVVAQAMDYGYWVRDLGYDEVRSTYAKYRPGDFDEAFRATFQLEPPETINVTHRLVIVASALDPGSERIVTYAQAFGLPINVVFFQTFQDSGVQYMTRAWLVDPADETTTSKATQGRKQQEPWNGEDWYVSFGEDESRNWEDARTYGFVSAGGGPWYIGTLRKLPVGGRVFVNIPGRGYVGVGIVEGQAVAVRDFNVTTNGQSMRLIDAPVKAPSLVAVAAQDDDQTEWVVPVSWIRTLPASQAIRFKGRYGNQNSATKLRHALTRETVLEKLGVTEDLLYRQTSDSSNAQPHADQP
jgi:hypothetical protein